jgi:hypothetical protein
MAKRQFTKPNVWDRATGVVLRRGGEKLDRGVNYFVAMLEQMGLKTYGSCEGHPQGFYVLFTASYEWALRISEAIGPLGCFDIVLHTGGMQELGMPDISWSMYLLPSLGKHRVDRLRNAADIFEHRFGPLDLEKIVLHKDDKAGEEGKEGR